MSGLGNDYRCAPPEKGGNGLPYKGGRCDKSMVPPTMPLSPRKSHGDASELPDLSDEIGSIGRGPCSTPSEARGRCADLADLPHIARIKCNQPSCSSTTPIQAGSLGVEPAQAGPIRTEPDDGAIMMDFATTPTEQPPVAAPEQEALDPDVGGI